MFALFGSRLQRSHKCDLFRGLEAAASSGVILEYELLLLPQWIAGNGAHSTLRSRPLATYMDGCKATGRPLMAGAVADGRGLRIGHEGAIGLPGTS